MLDKITTTFNKEFAFINRNFQIIPLSISEAYISIEDNVPNPGVYVFWKEDRIIKVGRSFSNSRKRSLQHIRDNTSLGDVHMSELPDYAGPCGVVLINSRGEEHENDHWISAIEVYLERQLDPVIRSKRKG